MMNIQMLVGSISFALTVILSLCIIPYLRKLKVGQVVRTDGPESHLKKSGTPTMGGIMMLIAILAILAIFAFKYHILILPIVLIAGFGIVGFIDDRKKLVERSSDGISAKMKMILLFVFSAIFIVLYLTVFDLGTELIIPFLNVPFNLSTGIFVLFTLLVLLGTSNAINLTDGLDGLCSGVVSIVMTFFTVIAIKNGDAPMIVLGAATVGATLGFLIFNVKPAKVFMGDTGSLALGAAIASAAIIMKMPIYLLIVALIPVLETLSVAMQVIYFKVTKGKRLFKMAPLHHHFELSGMKETQVVLMFWAITAVLAIVAYFI
ncbi:MAG: phospho-N-acetylmuramoyl-pentapeptide-transferase [Clostridia bacterium]|nr:phospho-N-acetylmuramoyl-pentapeptide-transferase [Clostridia bacterium]